MFMELMIHSSGLSQTDLAKKSDLHPWSHLLIERLANILHQRVKRNSEAYSPFKFTELAGYAFG
jgi:hypothetical protein